MTDNSLRLSGWKAIAAHFGRDRSTVLRWAADDDFPVRRVPGKKGGSVYAFPEELDDWLEIGHSKIGPKKVNQTLTVERIRKRRRLAVFAAGGVLITVGAIALTLEARMHVASIIPPASSAIPKDPRLAGLFLEGRDDWATRTPAGLRKAIAELGNVVRSDPGFAPAHAALAEAYLLSCEFDNMPREVAFSKAQAEAAVAMRIDPGGADGNRVLGFVDYWALHNLRAARQHFLRALRAAPASAETHHWYGNVLADNGETSAAVNELMAARTLDPGSAAVQSDYAWARWQSGAEAEAVIELRSVEARAPSMSSTWYFLAMVALSRGDMAEYLNQAHRWAELQDNRPLAHQIAAQKAAFERGGLRAALDLMAATPPLAYAKAYDRTMVPAAVAALTGDRRLLLNLLLRARAGGEHWRPLRWQLSLFRAWHADPEVSAILRSLFARTTRTASALS